MPMPDLTSKPLDPNEPTYCLCQQVSFGEMIGCDNDDVSYPNIIKCTSSEVDLFFVFNGFFIILTVSDRVVPLSVCWSDVQTEGEVVLSSVLPGKEV